jgi:hypothetical protein
MAKSVDDIIGKNVLVINEQGFGDEILFYSGIIKLAPQVKEMHVQVYPETHRLLETSKPSNVLLFTERTLFLDYIKNFDVWTTTGDLFCWSTDISPQHAGLNIKSNTHQGTGFCWRANHTSPNARFRSLTPDQLEPYKVDNAFSLQMNDDDCPDWMVKFPTHVKDFLDTAQLIASLEHVITVDTSSCHLAAALGIPTTLLINKHHDWRWKQVDENGNSLFYPSVKIIQVN